MTTLYLVRHGQTQWNAIGRYQGWKDSPLTALGRQQAAANGDLLRREGVDRIVASPLGRTRQTTQIIVDRIERDPIERDPIDRDSVERSPVECDPIEFDDRLREVNVGDWGGMTLDDVRAQYPAQWEARSADPIGHRPPNGENRMELQQRVAPLIDEIIAAGVDRIAIVSHGITTRVILNHLLRLTVDEQLAFTVPNDCVYRCAVDASQGATSVEHFTGGEGPVPGLFIRKG